MHFSVSCVVVATVCLMAGALPGAEASFCAKNIVTSNIDICGPKPPVVYLADESAKCPPGCTALNPDCQELYRKLQTVTRLTPCCSQKTFFQILRSPRQAAGEGLTENLKAEYRTVTDSRKELAKIQFAKATGLSQNELAARRACPSCPLCFTNDSFEVKIFCHTCIHEKGLCCGGGGRCGLNECYQVHERPKNVVQKVLKMNSDVRVCPL